MNEELSTAVARFREAETALAELHERARGFEDAAADLVHVGDSVSGAAGAVREGGQQLSTLAGDMRALGEELSRLLVILRSLDPAGLLRAVETGSTDSRTRDEKITLDVQEARHAADAAASETRTDLSRVATSESGRVLEAQATMEGAVVKRLTAVEDNLRTAARWTLSLLVLLVVLGAAVLVAVIIARR